jgi:GTPase SAR1 family protein
MSKEILLLGEFSSGKSAFINMLLGVQVLPERVASTNLPVIKIHAGSPGGIWLREPGEKNPLAIDKWGDIPDDWNLFDHAELTVSGHPLLNQGLVLWDTPGINSTHDHHQKHLDAIMRQMESRITLAFFFLSGNVTEQTIQFLKQWESLHVCTTVILNIHSRITEKDQRQLEASVKKTIRSNFTNMPVELLNIGDVCEQFNIACANRRGTLSEHEVMRRWQEMKVSTNELLAQSKDGVAGEYLFEIIEGIAARPETRLPCEAPRSDSDDSSDGANRNTPIPNAHLASQNSSAVAQTTASHSMQMPCKPESFLTFKHSGLVNVIAFSNDGCYLACGGSDLVISIRDARTGECVQKLRGHTTSFFRSLLGNGITSLAFNADGSVIASVCDTDSTLRLWRWRDGIEITQARMIEGIAEAAFSRCDGLYCLGRTQQMFYWADIRESSRITASVEVTQLPGSPTFVCDPTAETRIALGRNDGKILVVDALDGKAQHFCVGHVGKICNLCFSSNGQYLVSGGTDATVRVWDWKEDSEVRRLSWHAQPCWAIFYPNNDHVLSCDTSGMLVLTSVLDGRQLWNQNLQGFRAIDVSRNGSLMATVDGQNVITFWRHSGHTEL